LRLPFAALPDAEGLLMPPFRRFLRYLSLPPLFLHMPLLMLLRLVYAAR